MVYVYLYCQSVGTQSSKIEMWEYLLQFFSRVFQYSDNSNNERRSSSHSNEDDSSNTSRNRQGVQSSRSISYFESRYPARHTAFDLRPDQSLMKNLCLWIGSQRVDVKWCDTEKVTSLIIILSNNEKTRIRAFYFNAAVKETKIHEDLTSQGTFLRITIFGLDNSHKVLLSSDLNNVHFGTRTVTLKKHKSSSSLTTFFSRNDHHRMMKSVIEQRVNGQVVFNAPTNTTCSLGNLISVQTSSSIGSTLSFNEYIFYQKDIARIILTLPSRERVIYSIYKMDRSACFQYTFITHNTKQDVAKLLEMANNYIYQKSRQMIPVCVMYRNKPYNHSTIVESRRTGILTKYLKDNNGDQASSINNQIEGLFFSASPDNYTLQPRAFSYFGNYRIKIPPKYLLTGMNMYFADFYCNNKAHYVTLVVTKPDSYEDSYCAPRLVKLDVTSNNFLRYSWQYDEYFTTRANLWVEVLYTLNINKNLMITENKLEEEIINDVRGRGQSTKNGFPKNTLCDVCNLNKRPTSSFL